MKFFSTVSLILTLISIGMAQPVINRSHLMFPGDDFYQALATSIPDPGPAGAVVVWDFSGVQGGGTTELTAVNPDETPFAAQYPGSNIVFVNTVQGSESYSYQLITENVWEEHGYVSGIATAQFTDPRTYVEFPVAYLSQWQDAFSYMIEFQIDPPAFTMGEGTIDVRVDGHGTLLLPQAGFDDVLRICIITEATDTSDLGDGLYERNYYFDTTYIWMSPSYHASLCSHNRSTVLRTTTIIFGDTLIFPETLRFSSFSFDPMAEPISAIDAQLDNSGLKFSVSPNPFMETLKIAFTSDRFQEMHLTLLDQSGHIIRRDRILAEPGENIKTLQLSEISGRDVRCAVAIRG